MDMGRRGANQKRGLENNFVLNNVLKKYEDFVGGLCLNKKYGVYAIGAFLYDW